MFSSLGEAPADPILGLSKAFAADASPDKVDLGIGVYKDAAGDAVVLQAVKDAERHLVTHQDTKAYIGSAGNALYTDAIRSLILGSDSPDLQRARTAQTPGGTGALRVAADFIRRFKPKARIFIPDPTWANHKAIFPAAGLEVVPYPYYDIAEGALTFGPMMVALKDMTADDVLLLQGCCHNPTGQDPDTHQWAEITRLLQASGATPLIDLAYQGFGRGLDEDTAALRALASAVPEMIIASSCSKNFALYRERVGALTLIGQSQGEAEKAFAHLMPVIRSNYSMPPDHGAAVVGHILSDAARRSAWQSELTDMRTRINTIRAAFADHLTQAGAAHFAFVGQQRGMFAMLGISADQVRAIRSDHHVHMTLSGRINVAGLNQDNVARVAQAVAAVG